MKMQTQLEKTRAAVIPEVTMLPLATFMALFAGFRFIYDGKLLSSKAIDYNGDVERGFEIGDYLYIEQNKFGNDPLAVRRRAGELILNIIDKTTSRTIGHVINGKVFKV